MRTVNERPGPAIRHIVMWNVTGQTPDEKSSAIAAVKQQFEGLRGKIPGMLALEIGVDTSRISYACDVVLVSDFEDAGALVRYASHPEHLRVREALEGMRTDRHQVDYPLAGPTGKLTGEPA